MKFFILTSHRYFEGVEEDKTLGTYRTLKRAFEVARADESACAKVMFNTPNYAIAVWSFPDTYAPPEQQPDGVLEETYNGHDARGGSWMRASRDARGVFEIHPFKEVA
jgi:hypothetical protein